MLRIADKTFDSHLFTGTGKFASSQLMVESISQILPDQGKDVQKPCKNWMHSLMNMEEHKKHPNKLQEKLEMVEESLQMIYL